MNYRVDKNSGEKAYMQLYYQLRRQITEGGYRRGSKLPSKRFLAEETGVSVITVEHAYALLAEEGYAESRERSGWFVIYEKSDFPIAERLPAPPRVSPAAPGSGGTFPFSVYARTARRVLLDYGEKLLIRSPNRGVPELTEALAQYLSRSGVYASPRQIVIGAGAEYLYSLLPPLLGRDRVFAVEDPCYEKILRVYLSNGVVCERLKLGSRGIRRSELDRSLASVLHVTPFHSYPSGVTADASKRADYLRRASERDGYLIEDNYDSELTVTTRHEESLFSADTEGRVLFLNTFSHTVAPSLRVGYLVLPLRLVPEFEQKLGFYSCTVPVFEQYLLAELLQSGDFERHVNRVRRLRRMRNAE